MVPRDKAIVLLSGGIDSATTLAICVNEGYEVHTLCFRYGQRHEWEVKAAERIAKAFQVAKHHLIEIDLRVFGGSALTDNLPLPQDREIAEISQGIPLTYVPARNTILLSYALALAEVLGVNDIFFGANALDYSGYPDCRPEYIEAFQRMANLATQAAVEGRQTLIIHTPLIDLSKAEIIHRGLELGVDYSLTSSCYDPSSEGLACGHCDACILRKRAFAENGIPDPIRYRNEIPSKEILNGD